MSDGPRPVRAGEELDLAALSRWLVARGLLAEGHPPLEVLQYPAGHSNLTYRVSAGERAWVLRRPPVGAQVKSGHDMAREHRVLSGLWGHFPVPEPLGYDDGQALGVPFFAMAEVPGVVVRKALPPGATEETAGRLCELTVKTLADLHGLSVERVGLGDLGRGAGFARRQIEGWARRWEQAKTEEVPAMERLAAHFLAQAPADAGEVLVHNDLKLDNLILDEGLTRVSAVLDWEMASVGCPWMDLGTTLGYWVEASDPPVMKLFAMGPTFARGSLDRRAVVARYEAWTGRSVKAPVFYFAFGLFKIAVVGQQIYKRFVEGKTSDPRFGALGKAVAALGQLAELALERDRLSGLGG